MVQVSNQHTRVGLAWVSISYFRCHFALAVTAFCSRRSRITVADALESSLDASLLLLQYSLTKASAESAQDLTEHEFVQADMSDGWFGRCGHKE